MEFIKDLLLILTSVIAIYNIDSWRREHKGKRNIELAEETLALFYEARDVIKYIRSPMGLESETNSITKRDDESETRFEARKQASVVFVRYDQNRALFNKIHSYRYRFMAQVGKDKAKPFEDLNSIISEIFTAARMLAILWAQNYTTNDALREKNIQETEKYSAIFYDSKIDPDPINTKLDKIIEYIEETCKGIIIGKGTLFSILNK
ncbi:MAG: hypothetical protein WC317_04490 [Candidatus Omnitrophota bacterium]